MSKGQDSLDQSEMSVPSTAPARARTTRRVFIKSGAAVTGGIILGGSYVKPMLRSIAVADVAHAYSTVPPPPVPPPTVSPRTIGYWKNHPRAWPVGSLTIGSVSYTEKQLLNVLKQAKAKDMTIMLAAQLIAAKLNVLSGAPISIQGTIDVADTFLLPTNHPIGSDPQGTDRTYAESLKNQLDAYNNSGGGVNG